MCFLLFPFSSTAEVTKKRLMHFENMADYLLKKVQCPRYPSYLQAVREAELIVGIAPKMSILNKVKNKKISY